MEEVQSWWEVPAVAHFCYVFRSAFNLLFFEIAELESALLNMQDPDMSISLEQLIIRLLQGCYDEESVTEVNWEEKLHELFSDNCEEKEENPFDDSQSFFQLTPRLKIEVLLKLCQFRLDDEGALEAIKNIPSEDMNAKCIGKDSRDCKYWYFCDERLYKEDSSKEKKVQTKKDVKNTSNKSNRQASARERRAKANPDVDKPWVVACFNISDWEKLMSSFSKSKNSQEKELAKAIQKHLPVLQATVAEKDRLLRKRFMEFAPKRTSSRISKVQEKKRLEELKAQEEAKKARLEAEKEQARLEAIRLKKEKESRQKRIEMRHKAIEERARRAKLREIARDTRSDDSNEDENYEDYLDNRENQNHKTNRGVQQNQPKVKRRFEESGDSDDYDSDNEYEKSKTINKNTSRRIAVKQSNDTNALHDKSNPYLRTYSNYRRQSSNNQIRVSSRLQNKPKAASYRFDTDESEQDSDNEESPSPVSKTNSVFLQNKTIAQEESDSKESEENTSDSNNDSLKKDINCDDNVKTNNSSPVQPNSLTSGSNFTFRPQENNSSLPRVKVYKATLLKDPSDLSRWKAAFDARGQKLHIFNSSCNNLAPKRIKIEAVKNFRTVSPILKSSLSKENQVYQPVRQTPFITYGKIIPSSPSIVRLDFKKPPNPPVSS